MVLELWPIFVLMAFPIIGVITIYIVKKYFQETHVESI